MRHSIKVLLVMLTIFFLASLSACSSGGGGGSYRADPGYGYGYGVGYGGYYDRGRWDYHPGYIGGGIEIDDGPVATQLPSMGMPDYGGMDMGMGMDMGGFDF